MASSTKLSKSSSSSSSSSISTTTTAAANVAAIDGDYCRHRHGGDKNNINSDANDAKLSSPTSAPSSLSSSHKITNSDVDSSNSSITTRRSTLFLPQPSLTTSILLSSRENNNKTDKYSNDNDDTGTSMMLFNGNNKNNDSGDKFKKSNDKHNRYHLSSTVANENYDDDNDNYNSSSKEEEIDQCDAAASVIKKDLIGIKESDSNEESDFSHSYYDEEENDDDDNDDDDDEELESEHAKVIAIGVFLEDDEEEEGKKMQQRQQQKRSPNDVCPFPPFKGAAAAAAAGGGGGGGGGVANNSNNSTKFLSLDEVVAKDIAQKEHYIKMQIKMAGSKNNNNVSIVRRRPLLGSSDACCASLSNTRNTDRSRLGDNNNNNQEEKIMTPPPPAAAAATTAEVLTNKDRQEKMRAIQGAQDGHRIPNFQTPRRLQSRTSSYTAPPRQPIRKTSLTNRDGNGPSSPLLTRPPRAIATRTTATTTEMPKEKIEENENKKKNKDKKNARTSNDIGDDDSDSDNDGDDSNEDRSDGIDLDDKTRQRILTRSTLVHARKPVRPVSHNSEEILPARVSCSTTIASTTAVSASASRPSDDKRSMRISPKITSLSSLASSPGDSFHTAKSDMTNNEGSSSLQNSRQCRPSDEKAQFRRRQFPPSSITADNNVENSTDNASVNIARNNSLSITTDDPNQVEDLEAQQSNDQGDVMLPGAFAIDGLGNDDQDEDLSQGISGYDSGFEDNDTVVEEVEVLSIEQESEYPDATIVTRDSVSESTTAATATTNITGTPLQAELYEVEAALAAEVLIEEEDDDPNEKHSVRALSVQISIVLCVLLLVAGIIMGVVIPRVRSKNADDNGNSNNDTSIIEGWEPVGEILTVEDAYKDNIRFGNSVSLSSNGERIAVGLPGSDDPRNALIKNTGSVRIFDFVNKTISWNDTTTWNETFEAFGTHLNAGLGSTVALSRNGKRLAVGAPSKESDKTGYVSIYQEKDEDGSWDLIGKITASNETNGGIFGDSIGFSNDGRIVAVADKYADQVNTDVENTGAVQIYQEINGVWEEMGLPIFGSEKDELFGWSVTLSGDGSRVAASSLGSNDQPGNVRTFEFDGEREDWEEITPSLAGESMREFFGTSLELSDDGSILAVGAPGFSKDGQEADVGIVRSYQFNEIQKDWSFFGQPLEGENAFDAFGSSLSLNSAGDIVAIGAPENDNFCDNCGQIQVFKHAGGTWNNTGSAVGMSEIGSGQFGYSVALSGAGDRLVGAAPYTIQDRYWSKVGEVLVFDSTVNATEGSSFM